eukprot:402674-Prorocentrum_minimum.AAC.1
MSMWTSGAPRGTLWTGAAPSRLSSGTPRASAGTCLENNTNHQPAQVCACDAIVWTLRAIVWTLRAIVWTRMHELPERGLRARAEGEMPPGGARAGGTLHPITEGQLSEGEAR